MLVIRLQRTGRSGHAMFRIVVQDSRRTPTSGKVVARLGSYDPHNKVIVLYKEKAQFYLDHGAQPSNRLIYILSSEGVKLPNWVEKPEAKTRTVRNPEKRRSTAPKEEVVAEEAAPSEEPAPNEEVVAEEAAPEVTEATEAPATEEAPETTEAAA